MKHSIKTHIKKYPYSTLVFCAFALIWIGIGIFFATLAYKSKKEQHDRVQLNTDQCDFYFKNTIPVPISKKDDQNNIRIFYVNKVSTPKEMQKGLGGVPCLREGEGMLFVFPASGIYPFWMKDMKFPIDIIWIDQNKNIVDITPNVRPESYPQTFQSKFPVRYVLEVSAGSVQKHGIELGGILYFTPSHDTVSLYESPHFSN